MLLFHFALTFSRSEIVGSAAVFVFLFVGGCGFVFYFQVGPRDCPEVDFVQTLAEGYEIEWGSSILHYLVPMRFAQFSFALIVGGFVLLSQIAFRVKKKVEIKQLYCLAGCFFGLLPVCDARLILPVAIFVGLFGVLHFRETQTILGWVAFSVPLGGLGVLQFPFISQFFLQGPGFKFVEMWYPLYLRGIFFTAVAMWLENLGLFVILSLLVCWFFLDQGQVKFYLPSACVFMACNYCSFQPESRLNFVVLFPLWVAPAVVAVLTSFKKMIGIPKCPQTRGTVCGWTILFVVLCTLSGVLGTRKQFGANEELWGEKEADTGRWIDSDTKGAAVFFGNCSDLTFIPVMTGRQILCVDNARHFGLRDSGEAARVASAFWRNPADVTAIPEEVDYVVDRADNPNIKKASEVWILAFFGQNASVYERYRSG
jgi:hypothetical protein